MIFQIWLITFDGKILLKKIKSDLKRKIYAADLTLEISDFDSVENEIHKNWWMYVRREELIKLFTLPQKRGKEYVEITTYILEKKIDSELKRIIETEYGGEFVDTIEFERRVNFGGNGTYKYGVENLDPLFSVLFAKFAI